MTCGHGFLRFSGWHGVCETGDMSDAMDRPLTQTRWQRWRKPALAGLAVLTAGWVGWQVERTMMVPSAHLARRDITIGAVERGRMHDFIPLRAEVVPHDTVYVDSVDGGRIERILANPGDMVEAGQPLVAFSNTQLELTVLEKEGQLIQSITLQETYQTQLEQSRLANGTALAEIDWNIQRLARLVPRRQQLAAKGFETEEGREKIEDELAYWQRRKPLQEDSNRKQEEIRQRQLPQIEAQLKMMQQDLQITRSKLDSLLVKAPQAGRITAIDLKIGQTLTPGSRIAEITPDTGVKLIQEVDQYYLPRLAVGQKARVEIAEHAAMLTVSRLYPQVKNGTFKIDLTFDGPPPAVLLPGQTVQGRLSLGGDSEAVIAPNGAFAATSGDAWVFVLDRDGHTARRRALKVGRRNAEQLEVLSGPQPGESIITSDYHGLDRVERVDIEE